MNATASRKLSTFVAATALAVAVAGCQTTNPYTGETEYNNTSKGAGIGAAAGAILGALSGGNSKERRKRALIGAGVGALAGGGIGYYMDEQEAKLRQQLRGSGVSVTRVGNEIVLNMPGNITFDTSQSAVKAGFYDVLSSVVLVLKEFDKTVIEVAGHTDSKGSNEYNHVLSQKRADSVGRYLMSNGIVSMRVITVGYGEQYPVADNLNAAGRRQNRRVELTLSPVSG